MADEKEMLLIIRDAAAHLLNQQIILPTPAGNQAMDRLVLAVRRHQEWMLNVNEPDESPASRRLKPCKVCSTPIFWAQGPQERWMCFEDGPVDAAAVIAGWRWVIDFVEVTADGHFVARAAPTKATGEVWVNHQLCCGQHEPPKFRCGVYDRRYRINRERAQIVNGDFAKSLLSMSKRLE
jgi:hypothetical protein